MIIKSKEELNERLDEWQAVGRRIVLVPTMGYFHEGHLDLMRRARALADEAEQGGRVIVTNFVNPTQFGENEDLAAYPRDLDRDAEMAASVGVDLMFAPEVETVYPPGEVMRLSVGRMGQVLCGIDRPGHFDGVVTVVLKLFNLCRPDIAIFGEKDAQQLLIIRRMVTDLHLPVQVEGVATRREEDGLAMSSRNTYLTAEERAAAPLLYRALSTAKEKLTAGQTSLSGAVSEIRSTIEENLLFQLQYVEAVSKDTLEPLAELQSGNTLIALAALIGKARLIDNVQL
jgi:pantoate--beta-alanine ligase